mgnify:CR=1 FL=1
MKVNSESLYELINDGTIKVNTKIKVYKDDIYITTITFDGYDFIWETGTFTSGMLFNPLCDFEIIEEEKEIEELDLGEARPNGECIISINDKKIQDKINELVREVNKLKNDQRIFLYR